MMAGPQFFRLQTFARKANPAGQSVEQVLAEAARVPEYSAHVAAPLPPRTIFGMTPQEVKREHDELAGGLYINVTLKDGTTRRRGIRKDRHTLMTCIMSYPLPTSQIGNDPAAKADYDAWVERNQRFLRNLFQEEFVSLVEHLDEAHPHLHAYMLPYHASGFSARELNPAWLAKLEREEAARTAGEDDRTAVKLGNVAYRERARELQDQYHREVGLASGLTRTGPKRERLSRAQWRARKDEAVRADQTLRQMEETAGDLTDREEALTRSAEEMARDLAAKLDQAEALFAEAETEKALAVHERARVAALADAQEREAAARRAAAEEEARQVRFSAQREAADMIARAEAVAAEASRKSEEKARQLHEARRIFEGQKATIAQHAAKQAAAVVVQVIAGVLTGGVGLKPDGAGWFIRDEVLRKRVQALQLGEALRDVVALVSGLWDRLKA